MIGRAVGITGGGPLKRGAAPRVPVNAIRSSPDDHGFIQVREPLQCISAGWAVCMMHEPTTGQLACI